MSQKVSGRQIKQLKYGLTFFAAIFGLFVLNKFFHSSSESSDTAFEGISSTGHDLSNEEVNSLIVQLNNLEEIDDFKLATPYLNNDVTEQNYQFNGDVMIRNEQYVRLTQEKKHQASSFFSNKKMGRESFVMDMKLYLGGNGDVQSLHGDGFAIFFSTEKLLEGELFGVNEFYNGFGIYVDTYRNGRSGIFPYVLSAQNDGTDKYDHAHDGNANEISGCIARSLWNPPNKYTKARFIYVVDGYISLDFDYKNTNEWTNCFTLQDIFLPDDFHIGFSANTGDLAEVVDIIETRVYRLKDYQNRPVEKFQTLLEQLQDPNSPDKFEEISEEFIAGDHSKRKRVVTQKKDGKLIRKTIRRLQNAEKRIKMEAESRREQSRRRREEVFGSLKKYIYFALFVSVGYLLTIVYRVQKKKGSRKSGLLD